MEYSEIFLIAFILLAVFAGAQVKRFCDFLRGAPSAKQKNAVAPKTVLTMDDLVIETEEKNTPSQSTTHTATKKQSKTTVKKTKTKSAKSSVKTKASKTTSKKKISARKK